MVFGFVTQSGGLIDVSSKPGVGTTFRIYLPRATTEGQALRPATVLLAAPQPHGGEMVLVVEDNASLRQIVMRRLKDMGYQVIAAEDADKALLLMDSEKIDLLLTDIVMPGTMNGIALARLVQTRWPRTRIVLTSGNPDARIHDDDGLPMDTVYLLAKPYRKEVLAKAVREALDLSLAIAR
jgi:hypothetical protein